jgi:WD40 repeat protein
VRKSPNAEPWKRAAVCVGLAWGGLLLASPVPAQGVKLRATFTGHSDAVHCVAVSPDGKTIASGSVDDAIRFWDVSTGKNTATLSKAHYWVDSLAFSPDGKTLAAGAGGNNIRLWDVATHKATTLLDADSQYARPLVVFSADGKTLASGGPCISDIRVWDLTTRKQIATLEREDLYGIRALFLSPDGKKVASFGDEIEFWDVTKGKLTARLERDDHGPSAAFSADGKTLAVVCAAIWAGEGGHRVVKTPECIRLRKVTTGKEHATLKTSTGKEQQTLRGFPADVQSVVFSPDGKTLASGDLEGKIKLWDVANGKQLAAFKGHDGIVSALAFSPDSRMLVSSGDKTIKLWDMMPGK